MQAYRQVAAVLVVCMSWACAWAAPEPEGAWFVAAAEGDLIGLMEQIATGADAQAVDAVGRQALYWAARNGHREAVEFLLVQGLEVNRADQFGLTPLYGAASFNRVEVVRLLVAKGSDVNVVDVERGQTVLFALVEKGYLELAGELLEKGLDANRADAAGYVPLHVAAGRGHEGFVRLLLEHGADINAEAANGHTALVLAAGRGNMRLVRVLVEAGADVNAVIPWYDEQLECDGGTLLNEAAAHGDVELVEYLLDHGADVNALDVSGQTALWKATMYGNMEMVKLLVERGADVNCANDGWIAPYSVAEAAGQHEILGYLREHGAHPLDGRMPEPPGIHGAARGGRVAEVRKYLDEGVDANAAEDGLWRPLHHAAQMGHLDVMKLLLERGADIDAQTIHMSTPLHAAANYGTQGAESVRYLVARGADVNAATYDGETVLHAMVGAADLVTLLLEHGANPNAQDYHGFTPLHEAVEHGETETAAVLIAGGADMRLRNRQGRTPMSYAMGMKNEKMIEVLMKAAPDALQQAVRWKRMEMLRGLIEGGADINAVDGTGHTALHVAAMTGNVEAASFLLTQGARTDVTCPGGLTALDEAREKGQRQVAALLATGRLAPEPVEAAAPVVWPSPDELRARQRAAQREDRAMALFQWQRAARNPLHVAALEGDVEAVRELLDAGADMSATEEISYMEVTPLMCAVEFDRAKVVEELLGRGVVMDQADGQGETALHRAVQGEWHEIAQMLLDNGASVEVRDRNGHNALDWAGLSGDVAMIELVARAYPGGRPGPEALAGATYYAARNDKVENVRKLLEMGADPSWRSDQPGRGGTVLHAAVARYENTELMGELLAAGAELDARNVASMTPLMVAAQGGKTRAVKYLLEQGADVKARDGIGRGVLHHIYGDDWRTAEVLIAAGADLNVTDHEDKTPLHRAAEQGAVELVALYLNAGADVNALDKEGKTALHHGVSEGSRQVVRSLVERGADLNVVDKWGWTSLHMAADSGKAVIAEVLLEGGAAMDVKDRNGRTALEVAERMGKTEVVEVLRRYGG